jgi:hypothetical protein
VIFGLLIVATRVNGQQNDSASILAVSDGKTPQSIEGNCAYLPLLLKFTIPEIEAPSGRWPYSYGQPLPVTYRYLDELNDTSHRWRISFVLGISNWNSAETPIALYLYSQSQNTISMIDDPTKSVGGVTWYSINGVLLHVDIYGNYYWEDVYQWTDNQRQSIATHEVGHLQGVGHIPNSYLPPAIMYDARTNEQREIYYVPQVPDIALVNQVYP